LNEWSYTSIPIYSFKECKGKIYFLGEVVKGARVEVFAAVTLVM
jgi:hypothetical protein